MEFSPLFIYLTLFTLFVYSYEAQSPPQIPPRDRTRLDDCLRQSKRFPGPLQLPQWGHHCCSLQSYQPGSFDSFPCREGVGREKTELTALLSFSFGRCRTARTSAVLFFSRSQMISGAGRSCLLLWGESWRLKRVAGIELDAS